MYLFQKLYKIEVSNMGKEVTNRFLLYLFKEVGLPLFKKYF